MKRMTIGCVLAAIALAAIAGPAAAQDLQQRLAAVKQSVAATAGAAQLHVAGEDRVEPQGRGQGHQVDSCRYGPDGKVQKTLVVQPPPPEKKRGLRGKIVANKTEEMKDELQRRSRSSSSTSRPIQARSRS